MFTKIKKVNITNFRRDVGAFAEGYRKYPKALKGVRGVFSARETRSLQKQTGKLEQDIEKLEKALAAKKSEEQKFAKKNLPKLAKSKKLVRFYLDKSQSEDFLASHSK